MTATAADTSAAVPLDTANAALRYWAENTPAAPFVLSDGAVHTYRDVLTQVQALAAGLTGRGFGGGDRVAILADSHLEYLQLWFATNLISAVDVPVNIHLRGDGLVQTLTDADPAAIVCSTAYLPEVAAAREYLHGLQLLSVLGDHSPLPGTVPYRELAVGSDTRPGTQPAANRLATIMYTSGTTGTSKGVMIPQGYYPWYGSVAADLMALTPDDRIYCCQPLYHVDGRLAVLSALSAGGSVVLADRFSVRNFWAGIRATASTRFFYVGSMVWMLFKQAEQPDDARQPAALGLGSSTPAEIHREFERRFGTALIDTFGMSEGALLTGAQAGQSPPGSMGRPLPGFDMQLFGADGRAVDAGQTGEIVMRPREPNVFPLGYWRKADATVEAWRDLWFRTGDLAVEDAEGFWRYVGRNKDVIRRRGENISAWEVEQAFLRVPDVAEAAAFGVASDVGEEDLAVLLVPSGGQPPQPSRICDVVARNVPRYMVPRYVEFVESLPKTASHRVEKSKVRARGLSDSAWDAQKVGWQPPDRTPGGSS